MRPSMSFWCASSDCPKTRSTQSAQSRPVGSASSTRRCFGTGGCLREAFERIVAREERELRRRERTYRGDLPPVELTGKTIILVDDGLATGSSMRAAVKAASGRRARRIVVAVPVGPAEAVRDLARLADEVV